MRVALENKLQLRPLQFSREEIEANLRGEIAKREAAKQFSGLEGYDFKAAMSKAGFAFINHTSSKELITDTKILTRYETKLKEAKSGCEMLEPVLTALSEISDAGDAYDAMAQSEFDDFTRLCKENRLPSSLVHCRLERHMRGVLADMAFGDGRLADKLPETICRHWNKNPHSSWGAHVFLGSGNPVQELPENLKGYVPYFI